ncbi:MAG: hypothetical protein ACI9NN_002132, partial [Bacteroidia bacterium]
VYLLFPSNHFNFLLEASPIFVRYFKCIHAGSFYLYSGFGFSKPLFYNLSARKVVDFKFVCSRLQNFYIDVAVAWIGVDFEIFKC